MRSSTDTSAKSTKLGVDIVPENAREEMTLLMLRELTLWQQRDLLPQLRALIDANRVTRSHLCGKRLRGVPEDDVRKAYGPAPVFGG